MKLITDLDSYQPSKSSLTIGTFDGVHIGHRKIIERLVNIARKNEEKAVVLTFFPHPRMVLQKDSDIKLLNTLEEKSELLSELGVDELVVKEFTTGFSRMTALEFVRDLLVNVLNTRHIIIGYDHRFGRNRAANIDDLKDFGETYDFRVIEIPAQEVDEVAVSSTKIRKALHKGKVHKANVYLGYNYSLSGLVIKGRGMGKELGFPTANLQIEQDYKLIPKNGAYVIRTRIDDQFIHGMMNIGHNPTFNESTNRFIEIHLFDFEANLYGQKIKIEMLSRLRDEQKFDSIDGLKSQLIKDQAQARALIAQL